MTNETLPELISRHAIDLRGLNGDISIRGIRDPKDIIDTIEKLQKIRPYECEQEQLNGAVVELVNSYFTLMLGQKYDKVVSDELFNLRREMPISKGNPLYSKILEKMVNEDIGKIDNLSIPTIARVNYGESAWKYDGKINFVSHNSYQRKEGILPFKIEVKTPMLSRDVKFKAGEALEHSFAILTKAMKNPVIREYICSHPEQTIDKVVNTGLNIIWKPSLDQMNIGFREPEDVKILHRDPALLLKFFGKNYLLTTWGVHGEEPLEHYLREYVEILPFEKKK